MRETNRLSFLNKVFFGSGEIVSVMAVTMIALYFMIYLTDVVGIPPIIAGAIFMIGRAWDALIDPVMGMISDRTKTRFGRRRPYFLIAALPIGFFFFLLWFPFASDNLWFQVLFYIVVYVLFMTAITIFYVPYLSLITEATHDYDERTSINNYRIFFQLFFGLVAATVPKMIADSYGDPQHGYMMMGASVALFILFIPFLLFKTTFERPLQNKVQAQKKNYVYEFKSVFKNRYFRYLLFIYIGAYAAANVVEGFVMYYMKNWLNREIDMPILFVTVIGVGIISLPLWSKVSQRYGKKRALLLGLIIWAMAQVAFFIVTPASPTWLVYIIGAFAGLGYGVAHVIPWAMLPDVVDMDELETGEKREGLYAGVMTLFMKLTNSIAIFLIGVLLQLANYEANTILAEGTLQTIRSIMAFAPTLFIVIGLIATFAYPLTREQHAQVRTQIENRGVSL